MEIRIRKTGAVMFENEFKNYLKANDGPSYDVLTLDVMEVLEIDPVFEGPQATGGNVYQYSQRDGVEQIGNQWFTKYILGPVFDNAEDESTYKAQKDAEQAKVVRADRDARIAATDWKVIKTLEANAPADFDLALYRQNLRDITTQDGFPWSVVWPTEPV